MHLGIFQKTCTGVRIDFFLVEPHFLPRPLCLDTVIWRFSGYRMDFGSGNRVSNCRSWDFLPFPTIGWCTWIVLFCTRVRNHAVNSNISFSPLPFGGTFFLDWHLEWRALQRGCFGEWSMASLWWAVGEEFQRAGTEKMHREAVHSKWLPLDYSEEWKKLGSKQSNLDWNKFIDLHLRSPCVIFSN